MNRRIWILFATILAATVAVFLFPPIPQSEAYHNFADRRQFLGIPNCFDVISNGLFLVVGLLGLRSVSLHPAGKGVHFIRPGERWPWLAFFLGITLTAFGSAYYHLNPNDATLVWDRIPMAITFMALVAAVIGERISVGAGSKLLMPLIALGVGSVLYWRVTQAGGHGDLRPYVLVQFGSLPVLLLLLILFKPQYTRGSDLIASLALYAMAKIFESADSQVFAVGGIVSGHTLKHVAAALSAYWILRMLELRVPILNEAIA
jgi:hypothetical protein